MPDLRRLRICQLGTVGYADAVALQEALRERIRHHETEEHLLLLEHPHVYTLGRSADADDVTAAAAWLADRGIEVAESDRGGQVTYHGPGQLVGYPILDLDPDRRDLRRYVRDLQEVLVRTLRELGVEARPETRQSLIGVWSGEAKLASIGVHVSRWITTHGFALNLTTDLSYFEGIVACGLPGVRMASVEALTGVRHDSRRVAEILGGHFADVFERLPASVEPGALWAEVRSTDAGSGALAGG